jgi:CheY-like chemotaxis protein
MQLTMLETILVKSCLLFKNNVHTVVNGLKAYQMAMHTKYDLILMDLNMDEMNGFESCKLIKGGSRQIRPSRMGHKMPESEASKMNSQLPYVVAISASYFDEDLISKCKKAGFDAWFTVPLSAANMKSKIIDKVVFLKQI